MPVQTLTIRDWHPTMNPNKRTSHWSVDHKRHSVDLGTVCGSARFARWKFQPGRVRLTIYLVYPVNRLPDKDNAYARCKAVIDSIKPHTHPRERNHPAFNCPGFMTDDSPEWCEPDVKPIYEKGVKELRITMETLEDDFHQDGGGVTI